LSGCGSLPSAGPSASQVATYADESSVGRDYLLVDLSKDVVGLVSQYRVSPFSQTFAAARPVPTQVAGVGDVLTVMLFEAGQGGLFASDYGARVQLTVSVGSDGSITVPYAGRIRAAGRSTDQIETAIVAGLEGKAIQPQATVLIQENLSQTVSVSGDVTGSGRIPLTPNGDRVLDAIAKSGGVKADVHQIRVQLVRKGKVASILYQKLMDYPVENVYIQPGDQIYVLRDPETYVIMGAVGQTTTVPFERPNIFLLEGIARVGGLNQSTADRRGVFLFRYEAPEIAKQLRPDYDGRFGNPVPIVYRLDLSNSNAFFFAKSFPLRDKDLIYVAESPATEFEKFMAVVNTVRGGTGIIKDIKVVQDIMDNNNRR
jgi:polysaccharide export outer membrane protein